MACILAPIAEALVTTIIAKRLEKKEASSLALKEGNSLEKSLHIPFSRKLKWLSRLLWSGSALLAFEHVWHGEITPFYPFLTGAQTPESTKLMLREIATSGIAMSLLVTLVWCGMLLVVRGIEKQRANELPEEN